MKRFLKQFSLLIWAPLLIVATVSLAAPVISYAQETTPAKEVEVDCADNGEDIAWLICPIVKSANSAIKTMDTAINNLLDVDTDKIFGGSHATEPEKKVSNAYYKAWSSFRTFALGFVVIMALIVIISTAFGYEILDAYTIRKVLPRLLIAIIGITLSWSILSFLITLTNDVGNGIRAIIYAPFSDLGLSATNKINIDDSAGILGTILLSGAFLALGLLGLLSFGLTALLAVLCAFLVLVLRELVIVMLVLTAPIAIACLVLPNTRKFWQFWQTTLAAMLLAFPIIAAMIATGRVFSQVTLAFDNNDLVNNVIAFFAYIVPYFMLPFAFKFAGGMLATISGMANGGMTGMNKGLQKYRQNQTAQNMHKMKTGNRFESNNVAARNFNRASSGTANLANAGFNPRHMRSRMQEAASTRELAEAKEGLDKNEKLKAIIGNDDYNNAAMHSIRTRGGRVTDAGVREYLADNGYEGRSLEQGVAAVRSARRSMSDHSFAIATTVANAGTGTAYAGGEGDMLNAINEVAGGDRHLANRMLADSRGLAERQNRVDLAGAGFGGAAGRMEALHQSSQNNNAAQHAQATQQASQAAAGAALDVKDARTIASARGNAVANLAPGIMQNLHTAMESGDQTVINRELANIAGKYDAMSSASPENARVLANNVLAQTPLVGGNQQTVQQMIEGARQDPRFLEMRREYGRDPRGLGVDGEPGQGGPPAGAE